MRNCDQYLGDMTFSPNYSISWSLHFEENLFSKDDRNWMTKLSLEIEIETEIKVGFVKDKL